MKACEKPEWTRLMEQLGALYVVRWDQATDAGALPALDRSLATLLARALAVRRGAETEGMAA